MTQFTPRPDNPELHDEQASFCESTADLSILVGGHGSGISSCAYHKLGKFLTTTTPPCDNCPFYIVGESVSFTKQECVKFLSPLAGEMTLWGRSRFFVECNGLHWKIEVRDFGNYSHNIGGLSLGGFLIVDQCHSGVFEELYRTTREYSLPGSRMMAFTPVLEDPRMYAESPTFWLAAMEKAGLPDGWKIFHSNTAAALQYGQITSQWYEAFFEKTNNAKEDAIRKWADLSAMIPPDVTHEIKARSKLWERWLRNQPSDIRDKICHAAVERLMEIGEVRFRADDYGEDPSSDETIEEMLYWESCGDGLHE